MGRLVGLLLAKAEADGAPPPGADAGPLVALDEVAERARREKYQAPEMAVPRGGASVSDSLSLLRESRAALNALRPRVEAVGAAAHAYPHPAFGPLNLYQWLAFVALHEDRHRRQIETLLTAATHERSHGRSRSQTSESNRFLFGSDSDSFLLAPRPPDGVRLGIKDDLSNGSALGGANSR